MADTKVLLGDFEFTHAEIPESITPAVAQQIAVKKFVGGKRSVDVMGKDDQDISWSGILSGPNALQRAEYLRYLTAQGNPLLLSFFDLKFNVVISRFSPKIERYYRVPYEISFVIVDDLSNPVVTAFPAGFLDAIFDDLALIADLIQLIKKPHITVAFEALSAFLNTLVPNTAITKEIRDTMQGLISNTLKEVSKEIANIKDLL